jgi:hypothetical protein
VWFKVDDRLAFHPKALAAGNAALGLWVRSGSYCGLMLTDGLVPAEQASTFGSPGQAKALVSSGLWVPVPGGYQFHDWQDFQPTREQVERRRAAGAERLRRWREGRGGEDG